MPNSTVFALGREPASLQRAVAAFYKEGKSLTYDQGGDATTMGCAEAVLRKIK